MNGQVATLKMKCGIGQCRRGSEVLHGNEVQVLTQWRGPEQILCCGYAMVKFYGPKRSHEARDHFKTAF